MECRVCSAATHVLDTRPAGEAVRRRRECLAYGAHFTTYETHRDVEAPVDPLELAVVEFVRGLDPTFEEATPPCPT
jgi:transcriptional regulator NrdR family protein